MMHSRLGTGAWREGGTPPPPALAALALFGPEVAALIVGFARNTSDAAIDDEVHEATVRGGIPPAFRLDVLKSATDREKVCYLLGCGYAAAAASMKSYYYIGDRPSSIVSRVLRIPIQEVRTEDEAVLSQGGAWDESGDAFTYPTDPASVWLRANGESGPANPGPWTLTAKPVSGQVPLTRSDFDHVEDPAVVELLGPLRWLPLFVYLRGRNEEDLLDEGIDTAQLGAADMVARAMLIRAAEQASQVGRLADATSQYRTMTATEAAARLMRLLDGEAGPLMVDGWSPELSGDERTAMILNKWGYPYVARLALEAGPVGGLFQSIGNGLRNLARFHLNLAGSNVGQAIIGATAAAVGVIVPPAGVAIALAGAAADRLDAQMDAREAQARENVIAEGINAAMAVAQGAGAVTRVAPAATPVAAPATWASDVIARIAPMLAGIRLRLNQVKTNQFHERRARNQPYTAIHLH